MTREKPTPEVSAYMAEIGRRGGLIGGKRRVAKMTPEQHREWAIRMNARIKELKAQRQEEAETSETDE